MVEGEAEAVVAYSLFQMSDERRKIAKLVWNARVRQQSEDLKDQKLVEEKGAENAVRLSQVAFTDFWSLYGHLHYDGSTLYSFI